MPGVAQWLERIENTVITLFSGSTHIMPCCEDTPVTSFILRKYKAPDRQIVLRALIGAGGLRIPCLARARGCLGGSEWLVGFSRGKVSPFGLLPFYNFISLLLLRRFWLLLGKSNTSAAYVLRSFYACHWGAMRPRARDTIRAPFFV